MKAFTSLAVLVFVGLAKASTFLDSPIKLTAENNITIPYNETLGCGACVRAGFTYCIDKTDGKSVGRGPKDVCCDTAECILKAESTLKNIDCGHNNPNFNSSDYYFADQFVLLQKFCARRQDSKTCCGNNGNNECKLKLKYNETQSMIVDTSLLPFGASCTYKVEAKCGFPAIAFENATDIDISVAYRKNQFTNETDPDRLDTFESNQTFTPTVKDGKASWKLANSEKSDGNVTNETSCEMTKLYMTIVNLQNTAQPTPTPSVLAVEQRMLQTVATNGTIIKFTAEDPTEPEPESGAFLTFTALLSAVLILSSFMF